jgi:CBS domain-containing protein
MTEYHALPVQRLSGVIRIFQPDQPKSITLESPALDAMTDLRLTHAAVIEPEATIESANSYMKQRGVRSLFVLNMKQILQGVITATDILGEKPLRFNQERKIKHHEILVSDIMTPLNSLEAISIVEIRRAKVGHIVTSLRDAGRQHTLVTEKNINGDSLICGIFSLTQIEKQMGEIIPLTEVAKTFAEIEATLISN